jgi:hypothetical protein
MENVSQPESAPRRRLGRARTDEFEQAHRNMLNRVLPDETNPSQLPDGVCAFNSSI